MRDIKIVTSQIDNVSVLDIDIIDGEPVFVDEDGQTGDQRAALACYACKSSVPGMLDYGVSWASVYDRQDSTLSLSNELQQQIQNYAVVTSDEYELPRTQYNPMLLMENGGVGVLIYRGDA